jgi:hypothetical protein
VYRRTHASPTGLDHGSWNLWLVGGSAPSIDQPPEVIIEPFTVAR